jgi:hypothetical protein
MRDQQNEQILDMIKGGATDQYIISKIPLTRRTFARRMAQIRKQHLSDILDQQKLEAKASLLKICQEKIKWLDILMQNIVLDRNQKTIDRIAAANACRQYQIDLAKLTIEGPTIFRITKDGFYRRDDGTSIEPADKGLLQITTTDSTTTTTNDERQF